MATNVPNVKARMTIAVAMPITSLLSVAGSESSLPTWPPAATSMPARLAGSAVSSIRWAISSVSSSLPMLSSTGMNAICPSLLICDPLRSPKGLGAVSTSCSSSRAERVSLIACLRG